ncbi:unnamed protein product, partial [Symbiodinium necroappetens]
MSTAVAASSSLFVGKEAKEALSVELSNKLAECLDPDSSSRKKRQLQEIQSFRHYFSAKDLEILADETKTDQDKYDRVSARMFAVGLAFPTEASFAIIFHAAIAAGIKVENPAEGLRKLNQFKKVHRKKREATKGPFKDYVQRFPDDPEALPEELRDSYQGDPRQSLSEMDVREASEKLTGMRKSKKECSSQGSSQGLLSLQPAAAADLQAAPASMAQAAARALADVPAIAEEKKEAEAEKTEPDKGNQNMVTTPEKSMASTGEPDPKKPKLTMDFSPEQMALMDGWRIETRRRPDGHSDRYYYKGDQRFRT